VLPLAVVSLDACVRRPLTAARGSVRVFCGWFLFRPAPHQSGRTGKQEQRKKCIVIFTFNPYLLGWFKLEEHTPGTQRVAFACLGPVNSSDRSPLVTAR